MIGGVEAGGTKFILAVRRDDEILAQARIDTAQPEATLAEAGRFFAEAIDRLGPLDAVGLATFGPVDLDTSSPRYGKIIGTPKAGWDGFDIRSALADITGAPVAIDTDVNAAAYAEGRDGACQGLDRFCYVTVGTGIGVGFIENGEPARAHPHAEAGHLRVGRAPGDEFAGSCPYHHDCLEGLACGPAMTARWGVTGSGLGPDHRAWEYEAYYVAALCANLNYAFRPQRIILGGGVFNAPFLLDRVRRQFKVLLADYAPGRYASDTGAFLAPPGLSEPSPGLLGAFLLADDMVARQQ